MSGVAAAVVTAGTSLVSGYLSGKATEDAAGITADATDRATAENARQFDVADENLKPYRGIGADAADILSQAFLKGDFSSFYESPDYKFTLQEGEKALNRKQSAAGSRYGGKALKEAVRYGQGMASTQVDKFFNRVFNIAGMGQSAAAGTAQAALATGNANSNLIANQGATSANLTMQNAMNQNNAIQSGVGNLTTLAMYNKFMGGSTPAAGG